eukprot:6409409-Prymnesium_polylepis.1
MYAHSRCSSCFAVCRSRAAVPSPSDDSLLAWPQQLWRGLPPPRAKQLDTRDACDGRALTLARARMLALATTGTPGSEALERRCAVSRRLRATLVLLLRVRRLSAPLASPSSGEG